MDTIKNNLLEELEAYRTENHFMLKDIALALNGQILTTI